MTAAPAPTLHALIVAAGRGERVGGTVPKQYRPIAGRSVLNRSVAALQDHPGMAQVVVVIAQSQVDLCQAALADRPPVQIVTGGATRQESVRAGLEALAGIASVDDIILIHDAARPFVTPAVIEAVVAGATAHGAAVPGLPVTDTLKQVTGDAHQITGTQPRDGLFGVQTPQGFRFGTILQAHRDAADQPGMTDDASLIEASGGTVVVVPGDPGNIKLTTEHDFQQAEQRMASAMETRTGTGFDVHRFGEGQSLWLCGVELAHSRGLQGHSDADVALHALTDALLGAIAAGDIGDHFPPSDPQWRGAPSHRFLRHAADLVADKAGRITHVDVTLICEAPKIGPHKPAMRTRIAEILGISPDRVSVKATTTEKLGFTGRQEGIACQATATVRLPIVEDI